MKSITLSLLIFLASSTVMAEALLWNKGESSGRVTQSRFNYDHSQEAQEVSSFWSQRKMGVGMATAGAYGLIGGVLAIHFHPQWSVDLGYGGGSHFQSFGFRVKKMLLLSSPLNPYIGVGLQRWERNTHRPFNADDVSPGYVERAFMSSDDRINNRINASLLHGALGLQYTFTSGEWAGYGIFAEAVLLMSLQTFKTVPTASVGFNYFF